MFYQIKKSCRSMMILLVSGFAFAISLPGKILADPTFTTYSPKQDINIDNMLGKIRDYFLGAVIVACIFMIIWGAYDIATAGDSEEKVKGAKKRITYAVIGLIVATMASAIVALLMSVTEVAPTPVP